MRTRGLRRLALAVVLAGTVVPAGAQANGGDGLCLSSGTLYDARAERTLVRAINAVRVRNGRVALRPRAWIRRAARSHSYDMAHRGYFAHSIRGGRFSWAPRNRAAGENLAMGMTTREVVAMFLGSSSHRSTLMNPVYRNTGIGVVRTCTGALLVTQNFVS